VPFPDQRALGHVGGPGTQAVHLLLLLLPLRLPLRALLRTHALQSRAGQEGSLLPFHEGPRAKTASRGVTRGRHSFSLHFLLPQCDGAVVPVPRHTKPSLSKQQKVMISYFPHNSIIIHSPITSPIWRRNIANKRN